MKSQVATTKDFRRAWKQFTPRMRKIAGEKIRQLVKDRNHPSLRVHRLRQVRAEDIWVCYISINKRLLYQCENGAIYLLKIGEHAVVDKAHLRQFHCLSELSVWKG